MRNVALSLLALAVPSFAQSGHEPPIPALVGEGSSFGEAAFSPWDQPPVRPGVWPGVAGINGPDDDPGTLPSQSSGGQSQSGADPQPGSARQDSKVTNVQPCSSDSSGGTTVVNTCESSGPVALKNSGDVLVGDDRTAIIETSESQDVVKVGVNSHIALEGPASPVKLGYGSDAYVTNTSAGSNMRVERPGVPPVIVPPGATRYVPPVQSPPGV